MRTHFCLISRGMGKKGGWDSQSWALLGFRTRPGKFMIVFRTLSGISLQVLLSIGHLKEDKLGKHPKIGKPQQRRPRTHPDGRVQIGKTLRLNHPPHPPSLTSQLLLHNCQYSSLHILINAREKKASLPIQHATRHIVTNFHNICRTQSSADVSPTWPSSSPASA